MNLSDAIRLGAMLRPQITHALDNGVGTCALGAAYEAAGLQPVPCFDSKYTLPTRGEISTAEFTILVPEDWYKILRLCVPCPGGCICRLASTRSVSAQIPHLNDYHHWTREQIADWVAKVEVLHPLREFVNEHPVQTR